MAAGATTAWTTTARLKQSASTEKNDCWVGKLFIR
ncbi:Uncharacterised protein [Legionella maceachernii]|nr:Uncharacterised protein [Legionella maceachernii]